MERVLSGRAPFFCAMLGNKRGNPAPRKTQGAIHVSA
nr:MAG TPA: hypothetical protein [Caudoviricetes sp.]